MTIDTETLKLLPRDLLIELSENVVRKNYTPSELDAARRRIEPYIAQGAKERQREGGRVKGSDKLPEARSGSTRDVCGRLLGVSGRKLDMIADITDAAIGDPARYHDLVEEMDRTGKVFGSHRLLLRRRDDERVAQLQPVFGPKVPTLILDPPWGCDDNLARLVPPPYATMTFEELRALPIERWVETNSHIYLCSINVMLPNAFELLRAWGFEYKTVITWIKPIGLGRYFRNSTEQIFVRGSWQTRCACEQYSDPF